MNNTYLATNFWNNYDGTKDPCMGKAYEELGGYAEDYKAKGFEIEGSAKNEH